MTERGQRAQIRSALKLFTTGEDRGRGTIEMLRSLVDDVDDVPWRDELRFVLGNYAPDSETTGEAPLVALAQLVLETWATKKPEPRWRLRIPPDAKGLAARWQDDAGRKRAEAVAAALTGRGDIRPFAFGEHEGRLDFRGFVDPVSGPARPMIRTLQDLDFSGSRMGSLRFDRQTIQNCRFDGTVFNDLRLWSTSISDSSFQGADFGDTALLLGRSSRHIGPITLASRPAARHMRVDFSWSRLSNGWFQSGGFEDCDFSNAHLARAMFECDLVRCRFAGHLHDVSFFGHPGLIPRAVRLEDVDLRDAELHYVDFRGVDLNAFQLPVGPQIRIVEDWPCVRKQLVHRYPDERTRPLEVRLILGLRVDPLPAHGRVVIDLRTLAEDGGREGVASFVNDLDEAIAKCA